MAKKAKQVKMEAEGFQGDRIKEIDQAAEVYVELRDQRMATLHEEIEAKATLMDLMNKHSLKAYGYENISVIIEAEEKIKVKRAKTGDELEDQ
jgi:hypothetical protein